MNEKKDMEKRKADAPDAVERTSNAPVYIPDVDILETNGDIVLVADMPGVDEKNVTVTLEQDVLTIEGNVTAETPEGYRLAHAEYGVGDFRRVFSLSDQVNRDKISATVRNGVLRLVLPKAEAAKPRTIPITAG